jgi:predicted phosphodiesterase
MPPDMSVDQAVGDFDLALAPALPSEDLVATLPATGLSARRRIRPRRCALAVLAGALAAAIVLPFVHTDGRVGPAKVTAAVHPSTRGRTIIGVPPFGQVILDSHHAPIGLEATIDELDVPALQRLARQNNIETHLRDEAEGDVTALVRRAVLRLLAAGLVAGAIAGLLVVRRHRAAGALAGAGGAVALTGTLLLSVWTTYRADAFKEPTYTGALEEAPAVIGGMRREFGSLDGVRGRLKVLAGQISRLSQVGADPWPVTDTREVRILHVSDMHLNPMGIEIAHDLADTFSVEAVIDTGDLTSFGIDGEARIGSLIDEFSVPYYFVPGNHDSPENRAALARHKNVRLLDHTVADVGGIRILGIGDPGYTALDGISRNEAIGLRHAHAREVAQLTDTEHPDVLAVAGLALAEDSVGQVPLVISGDIHKRSEKDTDGTRLLTVGSTGATGLGSFTRSDGRPYEAEILHFVDGRLDVLDYVTVKGPSGAFTVDRVVYGD